MHIFYNRGSLRVSCRRVSSIVCRVERRRLAGPGCAQSDLCKVNGQPTLSCLLIDLSFFNKVSINIPFSYCLMDYNFRL